MVFAQHAVSGGGYPLIILLLLGAWVGFVAALAMLCLRFWKGEEPGRRQTLLAAVVAGALALLLGLTLSPGPPSVCTYTGLSHITGAYHLAALEWHWPFPSDYPLTVPALAALFVLLMGRLPEAFGAANLLLFVLAAAGMALLAGQLWRSKVAAWAGGLAMATMPLALLFAGGDVLSIGYMSLSLWAVLFALRAARGEGGRWSQIGLAATTILVCQTRAEAMAFLLVLGTLPLVLEHGQWRQAARRTFPWLAGALLLLLPHLANLIGEFTGGDRSLAAETGFHHAWKTLLVAGFLAVTILLAGHRVVRISATPWWLPSSLFVLLVLGLAALYGWAVWGPGTHCWGVACQARTWRTVACWLVSPKLVPAAIMGFALVGLFSFAGRSGARTLAWLVLWAGGITAASSIKMTGELPYEGARTQLPAVVPLLLVAVHGIRCLVQRSSSISWPRVAWVAACFVATLVIPMRTVHLHGFDEQAEFSALRTCMSSLPERSILVAPDDVLEVRMLGDTHVTRVDLYHLYRSAYLTEALGEEGRQAQVAPYSALFEVRDSGQPVYWLRSLNCYRTGDGTLTPSCQRALDMADWTPVCETTIDNLTYTADFFEETRIVGQTVVLGIYAIPGQGEEEHAVP